MGTLETRGEDELKLLPPGTLPMAGVREIPAVNIRFWLSPTIVRALD
jgi:hypothetical protein